MPRVEPSGERRARFRRMLAGQERKRIEETDLRASRRGLSVDSSDSEEKNVSLAGCLAKMLVHRWIFAILPLPFQKSKR
jgi:hypothetical protein